MRVYLKALLKCKVPVNLNNTWIRPVVWVHKVNHRLGRVYSRWYIDSYTWHKDTHKEMLSQSRLFIACDGALGEHGHGRDTSEFCQYVADRMEESMMFFAGQVAPRVEMEIAFDDPERFPYQYVKWSTKLNTFKVKNYLKKNYTWMSFLVLLILTQVLTLLIIKGAF